MRKKDLLDLLKCLENTSKEVEGLFGSCEYLHEEISILWEVILDSYGIDIRSFDIGDKGIDILAKFGEGKLTKSQAINRLIKLSKSEKNTK